VGDIAHPVGAFFGSKIKARWTWVRARVTWLVTGYSGTTKDPGWNNHFVSNLDLKVCKPL